MNDRKKINLLKGSHFRQEKHYSCGAAAYRKMLELMGISINEQQAIAECKTKKSGTSTNNVFKAFKTRKIEAYQIDIDMGWKEYSRWLELTSSDRVIFISGKYRSRYYTRGRDSVRHHAACTSGGVIFDPAYSEPLDYPSYNVTFNKSYFISEIIMIPIDK